MARLKFYITAILILSAGSVYAQSDERFYFPDKEWLGLEGYSYEEITFNDGDDITYSVLFKPFDDVQPIGTVVFFHGNGSNISKWVHYMEPFLGADYQVVIMDYRGYGLSAGTPTHNNIAKDARKLIGVLLERDDVKYLPLVIYGASIGTQVATLIASEIDDRVDLLLLDSAMKSFTDLALLTSPAEYHDVIRQYVTSPYSALESISSVSKAKLLIIHSETDWIPYAGAREIYDSALTEKEFWTYEGDHVTAASSYSQEMVSRVNRLLAL